MLCPCLCSRLAYISPHTLHRVQWPAGPLRHCGVLVTWQEWQMSRVERLCRSFVSFK